jgi:hypothetical protein
MTGGKMSVSMYLMAADDLVQFLTAGEFGDDRDQAGRNQRKRRRHEGRDVCTKGTYPSSLGAFALRDKSDLGDPCPAGTLAQRGTRLCAMLCLPAEHCGLLQASITQETSVLKSRSPA